jgi:hypothetical protein
MIEVHDERKRYDRRKGSYTLARVVFALVRRCFMWQVEIGAEREQLLG